MASVFRQELCLPFLFYEILKEEVEGGLTEEAVISAYEKTFGDTPSEDRIIAVVDRLLNEAGEIKETDGSRHKPTKKTFATGMYDYLSEMDGERLCFLISDQDPIKAKQFYCEVDIKIVTAAAHERIGLLSIISGVWYEAVLFGMGGHYKGNGPEDHNYDITENPDGAKTRLSKLGLM